jgi:DNA-directed RNA polymerase specialized sigma24 family protein
MGKKHFNRVMVAARESLRDAELLGLPAALALSPAKLRNAVRLLLVCRSALERQIVSLHALNGLSLVDAAARLDQPAGRVRDCLSSLRKCVASAAKAVRRCEALGRANAEMRKL